MIREVERWRGTLEARARRGEARKLGQFAYFDIQLGHPDWHGKRVLDFGGSDGNLLWNGDCRISHDDYYCLDIVREAVEEGRRTFPRAHWFHYDRYNCSFNPDGVRDLPIPDLGTEFDFILAYSVFTHTSIEDMHDLVGQLRARLRPGGALVFTFEEPGNLDYRLRGIRDQYPAVDAEDLLGRGRRAAWCTLVHGESQGPVLFVESNAVWTDVNAHCVNYDVYHAPRFMERQFPDAAVRPRVNGESMHCCILRSF
jgi:SAM-dependent methyltransferase